ncbi:hypothetical protein FACS189465_1110 [Clostridia bacterium]|nr:hypothetical protein FACS189465_1110 [Clostridia bacterium]
MVKIGKNCEKLKEIQKLITTQGDVSLKNIGVESLRELRNSFDEI